MNAPNLKGKQAVRQPVMTDPTTPISIGNRGILVSIISATRRHKHPGFLSLGIKSSMEKVFDDDFQRTVMLFSSYLRRRSCSDNTPPLFIKQ